MYRLVKSWDNRREVKAQGLATIDGRMWTRRVQWLEDGSEVVKLKFDDGDRYTEVGILVAFAQQIVDRFKGGSLVEDAVSIWGQQVQGSIKSARRHG